MNVGVQGAMPPACEIFRDPFGFLFAMPFRVFLVPVLYGDDATDELNAFMASHRVVHIERRWVKIERGPVGGR